MANAYESANDPMTIGVDGIRWTDGNLAIPLVPDNIYRQAGIPETIRLEGSSQPLADYINRNFNGNDALAKFNGGSNYYNIELHPEDSKTYFTGARKKAYFFITLVWRNFGLVKTITFKHLISSGNNTPKERIRLIKPLLGQNKSGWFYYNPRNAQATPGAFISKDLSCIVVVRGFAENLYLPPTPSTTRPPAERIVTLKLTPLVYKLKNFLASHLCTPREFPEIPEIGRVFVPAEQNTLSHLGTMPDWVSSSRETHIWSPPPANSKYFYFLKKNTRQNLFRITYQDNGLVTKVTELCNGSLRSLSSQRGALMHPHTAIFKALEALTILSFRNLFKPARKLLDANLLRGLNNHELVQKRTKAKELEKLRWFFDTTEWAAQLAKQAPNISWLRGPGISAELRTDGSLYITLAMQTLWFNHNLRLSYKQPFEAQITFSNFARNQQFRTSDFYIQTSRKICSIHSNSSGSFCSGASNNQSVQIICQALTDRSLNGLKAGVTSLLAAYNNSSPLDSSTPRLTDNIIEHVDSIQHKEPITGVITDLGAPASYTIESWNIFFQRVFNESRGNFGSKQFTYAETMQILVPVRRTPPAPPIPQIELSPDSPWVAIPRRVVLGDEQVLTPEPWTYNFDTTAIRELETAIQHLPEPVIPDNWTIARGRSRNNFDRDFISLCQQHGFSIGLEYVSRPRTLPHQTIYDNVRPAHLYELRQLERYTNQQQMRQFQLADRIETVRREVGRRITPTPGNRTITLNFPDGTRETIEHIPS